VGFDSIFDRLEKLNTQQSGYPPHNVVKHDDDRFEIAIAVAGFNEKDLSVEQEENVLTIASRDVDLNGDKQYIHKGIATRKFKKAFTLGEYIEVKEVALVDGILSVYLEKNIPEEKKPKSFSINSKPEFLAE
jgi:molecular chaperone IbpA